jgi:hypothetical protein
MNPVRFYVDDIDKPNIELFPDGTYKINGNADVDLKDLGTALYSWYMKKHGPWQKLSSGPFEIGISNLKVSCDCGAEKAHTTHADWCSTVKK